MFLNHHRGMRSFQIAMLATSVCCAHEAQIIHTYDEIPCSEVVSTKRDGPRSLDPSSVRTALESKSNTDAGARGPVIPAEQMAALSVEVAGRRCYVKVAGAYYGAEPIERACVRPGKREVVVSCGRRNWIRELDFAAGSTLDLKLTASHFR